MDQEKIVVDLLRRAMLTEYISVSSETEKVVAERMAETGLLNKAYVTGPTIQYNITSIGEKAFENLMGDDNASHS